MRIYMVMSVLAPQGGIEAALVPLAKSLQVQGHEVIVYTLEPPPKPNQNAQALEEAAIEIFSPAPHLKRLAQAGIVSQPTLLKTLSALAVPALTPIAVGDALRRGRSFERSLQGAVGKLNGVVANRLQPEAALYVPLERAFRRRQPDVVHVHGWGCGEDPPGVLKWLAPQQLPVVYTEHNSPDPALNLPIVDAPMNLAHVLIVISEAARRGLYTVGRANRPIMRIPHAVDPLPQTVATSDRQSRSSFTITAVARLVPQKAHTVLLNAMSLVVNAMPQARLLLAGDGPLRHELVEQAKTLQIDENVHFLGLMTRDELPNLMAQTDVVTLPSYWEALPLALIEAMSAGKPIVASSAGGNPELVADGDNGLIVPPGDVKALADALLRLGRDPALRTAMGQSSRRRFQQGGFAPADVALKTVEAYHLAIAAASRRIA